MCELERAEAILKQKRREKQLQKQNPRSVAKKRRIIRPTDDSSDEENETIRKKSKLLPNT